MLKSSLKEKLKKLLICSIIVVLMTTYMPISQVNAMFTDNDEVFQEVEELEETEDEILNEEDDIVTNEENTNSATETVDIENEQNVNNEENKIVLLSNGENDEIKWNYQGEFPYISNVTVTDTYGNSSDSENFNYDGEIKIRLNFSIPNDADIDAGDYFTISIPDGLFLFGDISERLLSESSGINVTWEFSGNEITIRFYESLGSLSNVSGYMEIGCYLDDNLNVGEGGDVIDVVIAGHTIIIGFDNSEVIEATSAEVTKSGSYDSDKKEITWTITVTPDLASATLAGVTVKDVFDDYSTYVNGSFEVNGTSVSDPTLTDEGFEYTFPDGTSSGSQKITYKTVVSEDYFLSDADGIVNSVSTIMPNKDISSQATAEVTVEKQELEKVSTNYNALTQTISWRIVVNQDKLTLKDAIVVDEYCAGTSILENTIQVNGESISRANYKIKAEKNIMIIILGDIDDEVVITYDMVITDKDELEYSEGIYNVYNHAKLISGSTVIQEGTGSRSINVVSGDITINKYGSVRSNSTYGQYIQWEIWINSSTSPNYKELTDDVIFYDQLPEGLTLFKDGEFTVTVRAIFPDGTSQSIELNTSESEVYNSETREVSFNATEALKDNGVEVTADCTYVIMFATKIVDDVQEGTFTNTAYVTVGDQTNSNTTTVDVSYDTNAMIAKSGTYDYTTNTYDWTIKINEDSKAVKNAVITDNLPEGHVPAYDYIYVGETQVSLDGTKVNGITATYDEESNTITVSFEGYIAGAREIYISTKYVGEEEQGDATNKATLTADNIGSTFTAEATIKYESLPILEKRTSYTQGDTITWEVVINLDHDNLGTLTLEDQLNSALGFDESSVKLYVASISSDGTITKTEQEILITKIDYDEKTGLVKITLPEKLNTHKCYILVFDTPIMDKNADSITNSITFTGTGLNESAESEEVYLKTSSSSSGIEGESGSVKILKLDSKTNEPIEGVVFQILDSNKEVIESAGWAVTNSEGIAEFKNWLKFDNTYYIQEVRTVSGYVYDDTLYEVIVHSSDEVKVFEITVYNTPEELVSLPVEGYETMIGGSNIHISNVIDLNGINGIMINSFVSAVVEEATENTEETAEEDNSNDISYDTIQKISYNVVYDTPKTGKESLLVQFVYIAIMSIAGIVVIKKKEYKEE